MNAVTGHQRSEFAHLADVQHLQRMPRAFIAIDPPAEFRDRLTALQSGLPGARWTPSENLHVTLRFLDEIDGADIADLRETLPDIHIPPFELTVHTLGCFPPRGEPNQLWIGVGKREELLRLHGQVERRARAIGLAPDKRKYSPHITLARLNGSSAGRVAQYLEYNALFPPMQFTVTEFHLYSSHLGSERAIHEIIDSFPLG